MADPSAEFAPRPLPEVEVPPEQLFVASKVPSESVNVYKSAVNPIIPLLVNGLGRLTENRDCQLSENFVTAELLIATE